MAGPLNVISQTKVLVRLSSVTMLHARDSDNHALLDQSVEQRPVTYPDVLGPALVVTAQNTALRQGESV